MSMTLPPDPSSDRPATFAISRFAHSRSTQPHPAEPVLETLAAYLTTHAVYPDAAETGDKTRLPMWSPATFEGPRCKANAIALSCLVLDYDDGTPPDAALSHWAGRRAILYSSWSSTPERPKYRLVLPLARPVSAAYWPNVWAWASARSAGVPDGACKDASRAYYVPAVRPGAWSRTVEGELLEVPDDLPLPASERRAPPGWVPSLEALSPEVVERALRRWRERVAVAVSAIAPLRSGRRAELQRWTFLLAGHCWLSPACPGELLDAMRDAARRCGRDTPDKIENTEILLQDTIEAGQVAPLPVDELVGHAELAALPTPAGRPAPPPIVVKYRSGYWVRQDAVACEIDPATGIRWDGSGRYAGPVDARGMIPHLRERGDIETWAIRKDKVVPWTADEVLLRYGVNASAVELVYPRADGTIDRPWDPTTRTLRTTRSARVRAPAVEHPEVGAWLSALLGEGPLGTAALAWLATVDLLDRPTAALYLDGPPGVGKGLLAQALAVRWGTSAVPLEVAIGDYPIPLASCPIVHLDEGTALDARGTARFRTLASERSHALNEKYLPVIPLVGCPRILITANNADALGIREIRSLADLDAIAERVLHVPVHGAARAHLAHTEGWVTRADGSPGRVPEHLAWLAEAVGTDWPVAGRWVVPGVRTAWHDALLWRVPDYASTMGVVLAGTVSPRMGTSAPFPVAEDGSVKVPIGALYERWASLASAYSNDAPRPSRAALARILGALAREGGTDGSWTIDARALVAYARAIGAPPHATVPDAR